MTGFIRNQRLRSGVIMGALAIAATGWLNAAHGEGAIAIGILDDAAKGYAAGWSKDQPTVAAAEELALTNCRTQKNAPANVKATCKIVRTFTDQCVIVALDPEDGTPGAGWAVAETRELAERDAKRECERTAGKNRQGKCTTVDGVCDGKAR